MSHLQQLSAARQLTRDLQKRKQRHQKRNKLPSSKAGIPTKRTHCRLQAKIQYKKTQYNDALNLYELYLNQLLTEQAAELDKHIEISTTFVNQFTTPLK